MLGFGHRAIACGCYTSDNVAPLTPMGYHTTFSSTFGDTGRTGIVFRFGTPINFSEIFDGSPQFYPGSLVQIEEIVIINCTVTQPDQIDVDMNWWLPHQFLGTYQLFSGTPTYGVPKEDEGYINADSLQIKRYSLYTIAADPNVIAAQHEQFTVDSCNFYLQPDIYLFDGETIPVGGFRVHDKKPHFLGSTSLSKAPLKDGFFYPKIGGLGLFFSPGVSCGVIEYTARVINTIATDYPAFPVGTCEFLQPNCQQQFSAFLAQHPGQYYDTESSCNSASLGTLCRPFTFTCPSDPTQTFQYWGIGTNPIG